MCMCVGFLFRTRHNIKTRKSMITLHPPIHPSIHPSLPPPPFSPSPSHLSVLGCRESGGRTALFLKELISAVAQAHTHTHTQSGTRGSTHLNSASLPSHHRAVPTESSGQARPGQNTHTHTHTQ